MVTGPQALVESWPLTQSLLVTGCLSIISLHLAYSIIQMMVKGPLKHLGIPEKVL